MNGAANSTAITFIIPSYICKNKQGESVIEFYRTQTSADVTQWLTWTLPYLDQVLINEWFGHYMSDLNFGEIIL